MVWSDIDWAPELAMQPQRSRSLAPASRFRTGGSADLYFDVRSNGDLISLISSLPKDCPLHVTGLGSNTLFRDNGFRGAVVRLLGEYEYCRVSELTVEVGAGCSNRKLARVAQKSGIGGLEFLDGIPGTVGGSLLMNAGAFDSDVGSVTVAVTVISRTGELSVLSANELNFGYRSSSFPEGSMILGAVLKGVASDGMKIRSLMSSMDAKRRSYQPISARTCGSTFKNPTGFSARQLIVKAGLERSRFNGARLSELNCNFIVADEGCVSADIETLGCDVIAQVKQKLGVSLEWEICIVGQL